MSDLSNGIVLTDEERAGLHKAVADMNTALAIKIAEMDDAAKKAHLLGELKTALTVLGVVAAAASGIGIIPAAVLPFVPVVLSMGDGIVKAIEGSE